MSGNKLGGENYLNNDFGGYKMTSNIGALIIGCAFLCISILDLLGIKVHILKQYHEKNGVDIWQRKRFCGDILVSAGAWSIFVSDKIHSLFFIFGCIVTAIGFLTLVYLDIKFKKQA